MGFPGGSNGKKYLPAMQETWLQSLGQEHPLKKGMGTHSSILPGESHGQRRLAGQCVGSQRVGRDWVKTLSTLSAFQCSSYITLALLLADKYLLKLT